MVHISELVSEAEFMNRCTWLATWNNRPAWTKKSAGAGELTIATGDAAVHLERDSAVWGPVRMRGMHHSGAKAPFVTRLVPAVRRGGRDVRSAAIGGMGLRMPAAGGRQVSVWM